MTRIILLLLAGLATHCTIDRAIPFLDATEENRIKAFQSLDERHQVRIAPRSEPGERLLLCLTFRNRATKQPLTNQSVHFYQATTEGNYEPKDPTDESTARLNGSAVTDPQGRIYVETILPGDYGSGTDNRHIHTTVAGARPEAYDIHFKQYATFMGRRFAARSHQHFLADLKATRGEELVAFLDVACKF